MTTTAERPRPLSTSPAVARRPTAGRTKRSWRSRQPALGVLAWAVGLLFVLPVLLHGADLASTPRRPRPPTRPVFAPLTLDGYR